jgi:hypothetical protein
VLNRGNVTTTWRSNDDIRRDGGAEVDEFVDVPMPDPADELDDEERKDEEEERHNAVEDRSEDIVRSGRVAPRRNGHHTGRHEHRGE